MSCYLHGFGRWVPEQVVTNAELGARLNRAPEWIETATGIQERRWAPAGMTVAAMGLAAAEDCLSRTSFAPASIGMLLLASGSAGINRAFPGPASEVALRLGLGTTPAIDLPMASAGGIFALALAMQLAPAYGNVLVVTSEKMSPLIQGDPAAGGPPAALDPNLAILFGDGAAAALVSPVPGRWRLLDAVLHSDGAYRDDLTVEGGSLSMNGLSVILQASRKLPSVIQEVLARQHLQTSDVGSFLLHQANLNLLTRVAKALAVPQQKVFTNLQRYGNTSSASLLLAAAEWAETEQASSNDPVVFASFGAGFHWGAALAVPAGVADKA